MWIDIGVGVVIVTWALVGLASGFWSQFLRILALGSLYFIAPPVARLIDEPVAGYFDHNLSPTTQQGLSLMVAAVGLYIVMSIIIAIVFAIANKGKKMSASSRAGGFGLGAIKGVVLSYLLLCAFVMVAASDYGDGLAPRLTEQARNSFLVKQVAKVNLLAEMGYELPSPEELDELFTEIVEGEAPDREGEGEGEGEPGSGEAPTPGAPGTSATVQPSGTPPQPGAAEAAPPGEAPPAGTPGAPGAPTPTVPAVAPPAGDPAQPDTQVDPNLQ